MVLAINRREKESEARWRFLSICCQRWKGASVKMSRKSESLANPDRCRLGQRPLLELLLSSPILYSLDWFRHVGRTWYSIHHGHYLRVIPPSAIFLGSKCFSSSKLVVAESPFVAIVRSVEDWKYRRIGDKMLRQWNSYESIYIK